MVKKAMTNERYENAMNAVHRWDAVFKAASAEPRRQLVISLLDREPDASVTLPEYAMSPDMPADPDRLRRELVHCHLPLLADDGFVEWQRDPFVASRGPNFDELGCVFESLHTNATAIPDSLVVGCRRLEAEQEIG